MVILLSPKNLSLHMTKFESNSQSHSDARKHREILTGITEMEEIQVLSM